MVFLLPKEKTAKEKLDTLWKTDEWKTFDKLLKKVDIKEIKNPLVNVELSELLKTGTVLDELLGGGVRKGQLVELYGTWGSGKTQICFTLLVESKGLVVYVDSESTFSSKRIKQIAETRGKDINEIDSRILYFQPTDWKEQLAIFHQLPNVEEIELIIVDSLLAHFRNSKEFLGRANLPKRQGLIRTHLAELRRIAQRYNAMVIITNQITQIPDTKPFTPYYMKEIGVGGPSVHHVPDTLIYLRRVKDPKRIARLIDSSEVENKECVFIIDSAGISNVPVPVKEEKKSE